ncbi:MAG: hypothetical protein ACRDV9_15565, partial [Acidimicrobiia bacterium]
SQSALKACMEKNTGNCAEEVPGLKECMAAKKQCNMTEPDRSAANRPEGQGDGAPARVTEDEAKQLALSAATNPKDPANSTAAQQMTVAELQAKGQLQNSDVPKGVKVWVVTVHAKRMTLASPTTPAREVGLYTVIINAVNKAPIDDCLGDGCYSVG